ncbi:MAG: macro domain-containing protein [Halanaerobiales bacterium]|nr:macro domain-containing protein [Halanaerobiales bacterium]
MIKREVSGIEIQLVKGDISKQEDIESIVNAANAQLRIGGGVAGAIHRAAGTGLEKECRPLAPIEPGEAVITGGHQLPNKYVIHCLGPVYGVDKPEDKLLRDCYINSLNLAEENQIKSIAFPAISTGAFGYPIDKAVKVALRTVLDKLSELEHLEIVRFVLFSKNDLDVYKKELLEMI